MYQTCPLWSLPNRTQNVSQCLLHKLYENTLEHETKHDELFDLEHDKVSISTYISSPARFRKMKCEEHLSEITVACERCYDVFCRQCSLNTKCQGHKKAASKKKNVSELNRLIAGTESIYVPATPSLYFSSNSEVNPFSFPGAATSSSGSASAPKSSGLIGAATLSSGSTSGAKPSELFGAPASSSDFTFAAKSSALFSADNSSSGSTSAAKSSGLLCTVNSSSGSTSAAKSSGLLRTVNSSSGSTSAAKSPGLFRAVNSSSGSTSAAKSSGLFRTVNSSSGSTSAAKSSGLFGADNSSSGSTSVAKSSGLLRTVNSSSGSTSAAKSSGLLRTVNSSSGSTSAAKSPGLFRAVNSSSGSTSAAKSSGLLRTVNSSSGSTSAANPSGLFDMVIADCGRTSKVNTSGLIDATPSSHSPDLEATCKSSGLDSTVTSSLGSAAATKLLDLFGAMAKTSTAEKRCTDHNVDLSGNLQSTKFKPLQHFFTTKSVSQAEQLHQFVDVTQFAAEVEEKLKKKLKMLSDKKTDIYRTEKTTWRKVDETETRAKIWKDQVDSIIGKKIDQLITMGDNFKVELDSYSTQVADEAAMFTMQLNTEGDQLIEVENGVLKTLSTKTNVTKLVNLLENSSIDMAPVAKFSVHPKSVLVDGFYPVISLSQFLPTQLEYKRRQTTGNAVIALAAMSHEKILVGTTSNHLEIRDLHFSILFTESVPGKIVDVATLDHKVACLLRNEGKSTVYIYSNQLKNAQVVCDWLTSNPHKEYLAGLKSTLMICENDIASWEVNKNKVNKKDNLATGSRQLDSLCVVKDEIAVAFSARGIEIFCQRTHHLLYGWAKIVGTETRALGNRESFMKATPDTSVFEESSQKRGKPSATSETGILSKTRDDSGISYACFRKEIITFKTNEMLRKLAHSELSNVKRVTAIAICGNHLVVGSGEEGLKLFLVI